MNLQLFGDVDWRDVVETRQWDDTTEEGEEVRVREPIFRAAGESGGEEETEETDEESYAYEGLTMPRLVVTDRNLPHTEAGVLLVRDEEGKLWEARAGSDGTLERSEAELSGEMLTDGSVAGAKLEEGTITARELNLEELFGGSETARQMMTENLDGETLFENAGFMERLDAYAAARIEGLPLESGSLDALWEAGRYHCASGRYAESVSGKPAGAEGCADGFALEVIALGGEAEGRGRRRQIVRAGHETWERNAERSEAGETEWSGWSRRVSEAWVTEALEGKLEKSGGEMSGALRLSGDPSDGLEAAPKRYVDASIRASILETWAAWY